MFTLSFHHDPTFCFCPYTGFLLFSNSTASNSSHSSLFESFFFPLCQTDSDLFISLPLHRDVRRLVVAMSRARLGLYIFARVALFQNCFELTPAFNQLTARPLQLHIRPHEYYNQEQAVRVHRHIVLFCPLCLFMSCESTTNPNHHPQHSTPASNNVWFYNFISKGIVFLSFTSCIHTDPGLLAAFCTGLFKYEKQKPEYY